MLRLTSAVPDDTDSGPAAPPGLRRALASLALAGALGCGSPPAAIHLGLAGPFDDPVGGPMLLAARLAVAEINAAGGVRGRPLALIEMNDHGNPDSAVTVAAQLRASRAVAVIGHLWSSTTLAAGPVYGGGAQPVAMISPSSSAPDVRWIGPHAFRVCPSDEAHGAALADWMLQRLGANRVAVLYLNNDYGRGVRRAFGTRFASLGGTVIGPFPYLDPEREATIQLDRIARQAPVDAMLVAGYAEDAETVLRIARARGITAPLLGGDALEGIEAAGPIANGVLFTSAWLPDARTGPAAEFLRAYADAHPDAAPPNQPAAATWDAVHLLAALLSTTGADRRKLRLALAGVGSATPAFEGVTGSIAFTPDGDLVRGAIIMAEVRDGRLVRAGTP